MKSRLFVPALLLLAGCERFGVPTLFDLRSPRETGIDFANTLQEDDSLFNPIDFDYVYNGAGVAVGDLNNDGRPDLYFGGNMVSSRLYLNDGDLRFRDVTEAAGVGTQVWATGVTTVDINQDGLLDLYVSVAGKVPLAKRANLLFVNQGVGEDGVPRFREEARRYGIADTGYTTHAAFFDYDRDNDLDLYLLTNGLEQTSRNDLQPRGVTALAPTTDRLYRNNGNGTFTNVSSEAGIRMEGYGLGVAISDLNGDGWLDVYVSNDFQTNNLIWINNRDGTFTNRAAEYLKYQAHNAMGNDVADFNNDGLVDIVEVDMLPEDNYRRKMMLTGASYERHRMALDFGYQPQYMRNMLQLNNGPGLDGEPRFSEIGQLAGVHATDWSWAPLLADYDNDGLKDLFVTNGYGRDVTNLDYVVYRQQDKEVVHDPGERKRRTLEALWKLPEVKLHNYLFRNNGDLTFSDRSAAWGMTDEAFATGAAYADLDGDGDLDLVVSNVNAAVSLYENRSERLPSRNYLRVALEGPAGNRGGYGAKVVARHRGKVQLLESSPYRGYKSTVESALHFGLGADTVVDTLEVYWLDGTQQRLTNVAANRVITLDHRKGRPGPAPGLLRRGAPLMRSVAAEHGLELVHQEREVNDFKITPLLHRKHSQEGPGLAVGDVDGNGLDDVYMGADQERGRSLLMQTAPGRFARRTLPGDSVYEDMGALFLDADGDGDQDLFVVSGGSFAVVPERFYQDRLYVNDGRGGLRHDPAALPREAASGSTVIAADYDRDGDLDLFVGGRIVPGEYPLPARSFLLRNDSRPGVPRFTDVTRKVAPELEMAGLVTSALWTDFDTDGQVDLLVTGEWMPLRFFRNQRGRFTDASAATGLGDTRGWWNSLAAGDFDGDGDVDYLAGNLGLNSRYRTSPHEPVRVHAADFDENGTIDPVLSHFLQGKSYAAATRDMMIAQMITMKRRFPRYADYAAATLDRTLSDEERKKAYSAHSATFASSYVENRGGGKFALRPLPVRTQFAPVFGMRTGDYDADGNLDVLMVGNSYAAATQTGWYDSSVGSVLLGNGNGGFRYRSGVESGFFVDGDARGIAEVMLDGSRSLTLVSQNNDSLRAFSMTTAVPRRALKLEPTDAYAVLTFASGSKRREEFHYGSTYLSQSSRSITVPYTVRSAVVYDFSGRSRTVRF